MAMRRRARIREAAVGPTPLHLGMLCCCLASCVSAWSDVPLIRTCHMLESNPIRMPTPSVNASYEGTCGQILRQCLKRPVVQDVRLINPFTQDCNAMPTISRFGRNRCTPPGPPESLNASISEATKDKIRLIVNWKMPTSHCTLTGYHVSIRKRGSDVNREQPCLCFNLSMSSQMFMLSTDVQKYGCVSECLDLDRQYGMRTELELEITSLPIPRKGRYDTAFKTIYLPSCQELDPMPDYCKSFPPAPPRIRVSDQKNGSIFIEWEEPRHDETVNITGYLLYWKRAGHDAVTIKVLEADALGYMTGDDEIDNNINYTFWAYAESTSKRSLHGDGISGHSNQEQAIIRAINGGWTEWTIWTHCDTCDHTPRERYRKCANPRPRFGGQRCKLHKLERMPCNLSSECQTGSTSPLIFTTVPDDEEKEAVEAPIPFYHKTAFFITLCVGFACITIFIGFLVIVYRYNKPHGRKLEHQVLQTVNVQGIVKEVSKAREFDVDNVSLPETLTPMRPPYPCRFASVLTGESGFFDSPLPAEVKTVYISYSRKQEGQMERIVEFCEWLCNQGFDVIFDRWDENSVAEDIAGWIQRNIESSHFIISICSKTYAQAWLKIGAVDSAGSKEDITSLLNEDLEGYQMKRLYLETMLINTQLMRTACRNTTCIPVLLVDNQCEKPAAQRIPNALSNSKVYHLTDTCCVEASELLHRLRGIEQWRRPPMTRRPEGRKPSEMVGEGVCNHSVSSGTSTTTTYAESNYSDVIPDSSLEDSASR